MLLSEFGIENIKVGDGMEFYLKGDKYVASVESFYIDYTTGSFKVNLINGIKMQRFVIYNEEVYTLKRDGRYIIKDGKIVNEPINMNDFLKKQAEKISEEKVIDTSNRKGWHIEHEDIIDKQVVMLRKFQQEFPCSDELLQIMAAKIFDYLKEKSNK